jgi:plasmid stabilization system protein ParE
MSLPIVFRRAAQCEFIEAAEWYEERRPGRGAKFTAEVREVLNRIAQQPDFYPRVLEDVCEALVTKYPYCVYYRVDGERILVLSIFHTSRDPAIWQNRT